MIGSLAGTYVNFKLITKGLEDHMEEQTRAMKASAKAAWLMSERSKARFTIREANRKAKVLDKDIMLFSDRAKHWFSRLTVEKLLRLEQGQTVIAKSITGEKVRVTRETDGGPESIPRLIGYRYRLDDVDKHQPVLYARTEEDIAEIKAENPKVQFEITELLSD